MRSTLLLGLIVVSLQLQAQSYTFSPSFFGNSGEYGGGVTVYDINKDGWDDISYPNAGDSVHTYINNNGVFELHHFFAQNGNGRQIVFGDYDNDGDADAVIATDGGYPSLYEQVGDLVFEDVSYKLTTSITEQSFLGGVTFGDFNADGNLDIFLSNYYYGTPSRCYLFINSGTGEFVESAWDYGLAATDRYILNSVVADFNNDQTLDLWCGNDRHHKEQLFSANENNVFIHSIPDASVSMWINTMSLTPNDYDHDGDLDMYLTNSESGNVLLNCSSNSYVNVASNTPLAVGRFCWGALWIDLNNDMWSDLLVSSRENYSIYQTRDAILMNNQGTFTSQDANHSWNEIDGTYAFAKGDFNRDYQADFAVSHDAFSQNEYVINNFTQLDAVTVTLEGTNCNRDAYGSQIRYFVNGQLMVEHSYSSYGYCSQNSQHFQLPCAVYNGIDSLQVIWPSGASEWWYNLSKQTDYNLKEGEGNIIFTDWENEWIVCPNESVVLSLPNGLIGLWSNGEVGNEIVVNEAGDYFAIVNDLVSSPIVTVVVEENPLLSLVSTSPTCAEWANGSIDLPNFAGESVSVNGFTQQWPLADLPSGNYEINMMSSGCVFQSIVSLENPLPIAASITHDQWICSNEDASEVTIADLLNCSFPVTATINGSPLDNDFILPDVPVTEYVIGAGSYDLQLIDAQGCKYAESFVVELSPTMEGTVQQISGGFGNQFEAQVNVMGGFAPYTYLWSNGETSYQSTFNEVGSIGCTVTDSLGCELFIEGVLTDLRELSSFGIAKSGDVYTSQFTIHNLKVLDTTGRLINEYANIYSWTTQGLSNGVYCFVLDNHKVMKVWVGDE